MATVRRKTTAMRSVDVDVGVDADVDAVEAAEKADREDRCEGAAVVGRLPPPPRRVAV